MSAFLDAAFGFPAVIFTILLVPVVLYWLMVGVGLFDLDPDVDVDADAGGGDAGLLAGWWQALGLAGMPITVSLSLIVIFGWFGSLLATGFVNVVGVSALVRLLIGLVVLALGFGFGALGAALAGRPLSRLFVATHAEGRSAFVGRTCVVRTEKVTADFGQAEAADPSGATVLIPVRLSPLRADQDREADDGAVLSYGATALIVDYDREVEVFLVSPLDEDLREFF